MAPTARVSRSKMSWNSETTLGVSSSDSWRTPFYADAGRLNEGQRRPAAAKLRSHRVKHQWIKND